MFEKLKKLTKSGFLRRYKKLEKENSELRKANYSSKQELEKLKKLKLKIESELDQCQKDLIHARKMAQVWFMRSQMRNGPIKRVGNSSVIVIEDSDHEDQPNEPENILIDQVSHEFKKS